MFFCLDRELPQKPTAVVRVMKRLCTEETTGPSQDKLKLFLKPYISSVKWHEVKENSLEYIYL